MRCRFASPLVPSDQTALATFDESSRRFYARLEAGASLEELARTLRELDEDFELLSVVRQANAIELGLRGTVTKRPRVERFVAQRPSSVAVVAERSARPFDEVRATVERATGYRIGDARVRAGIARGHLLELVVYLAEAASDADGAAEYAAELAVEGCLGERLVDDWISVIEAAPLPRRGPLKLVQANDDMARTFPLFELPRAVDRAIAGVYAELPDTPLASASPSDEWTMLEAVPANALGPAQADLMLASTRLPEMLKCFLQDAPFSSLRFSKHAERFAYLKYETTAELNARVRERQRYEDALDAELRSRGLGCVVGNGIGRQHCYIDIAIVDVDRALAKVCELGRNLGLPSRSWILFCDTEWQLEWLGVRDDTPEPPGVA